MNDVGRRDKKASREGREVKYRLDELEDSTWQTREAEFAYYIEEAGVEA